MDKNDPQRDYYFQLVEEQRKEVDRYSNKSNEAADKVTEYYEKIYAEYCKYYPCNSTQEEASLTST